MTPFEFVLFAMNMVFFADYFLEANIIAELGAANDVCYRPATGLLFHTQVVSYV